MRWVFAGSVMIRKALIPNRGFLFYVTGSAGDGIHFGYVTGSAGGSIPCGHVAGFAGAYPLFIPCLR